MDYCPQHEDAYFDIGTANRVVQRMPDVFYSSLAYNTLIGTTDGYGITLWKLLLHGKRLADTGRRGKFMPAPPWLLLFKMGPIAQVKNHMNITHKEIIKFYQDAVEKRFVFHSKTGVLSKAFYDYLSCFNDESARMDFICDFASYMRGLLKRFPYPPLAAVPLLKTLKFKWFGEQQYVKNLKSAYRSDRNHPLNTQDATVFFKLSLVKLAETMGMTPSRAACAIEIQRTELQEQTV